MLQELTIKNYALIENLNINFSESLNIFTGETGAGKTIILDSLGLVLGDRASADFIRKGAEKCAVIGVFNVKNTAVGGILKSQDIETPDDRLIIRREIDAKGKSSCYCNDTPVTLQFVSRLGDALVDIHAQNEHQVLLKASNQLNFLDRYGKLQPLREQVSGHYSQWKEILEQLAALKLSQDEREHKIDVYKFQVSEIDSAKLKDFNEDKIEQDLVQLKNSEKLRNLAQEAYNLINPDENSMTNKLEKADQLLKNISSVSAGGFSYNGALTDIVLQLKDVISEIDRYRGKLEIDPDSLDALVERKDLILKLKKKYGQTVKEILQRRDALAQELEKLKHSQENIAGLESKAGQVESKLKKLCEELSLKRKKVGVQLEKQTEKEITELGMPKAKFKIKITNETDENNNVKLASSGIDKLEFVFSPNPGEDLKPLKEIASGGEMSRTMLAIKTVLGKACDIPVMVFDEIDAGVSGPMSIVIGRKLKSLSKDSQIFCITHLPQIASFGDRHYKVDKYEKNGRTFTQVSELEDKESVIEEIARMLSGKEITKVTRDHAKELIAQAK